MSLKLRWHPNYVKYSTSVMCLVTHDPPIVIGGAGRVITIDESLYCHKVKVYEMYLQRIIIRVSPNNHLCGA